MVDTSRKYSLSITGAGTYRVETAMVARDYLDCCDWTLVRRHIVDDDLMTINSISSRERSGGEIIKRLKTLSNDELEFFAFAMDDDQLAMLWLVLCRTYQFLHSFSENVVAARYNRMVSDLPRTTYLAFIEEEGYEHPELAALTEKTKKKIESQVFMMLRDCHLLNDADIITPLYPTERFVNLVRATNPDDLNIFPKAGALL